MSLLRRLLFAALPLVVIALLRTGTLSGATLDGDQAVFASQIVPDLLMAGQTNLVSVRMVNAGSTTWSATNQYFLGAVNPDDNLTWGFNRVSLFTNAAPGATATFNFQIVAPLTPAAYNLQWRMTREGAGFFGQPSSNVVITVIPPPAPGNSATFISQTVPTLLPATSNAVVSITLRNSGTTTWNEASRHRLGAINPLDNRTWNIRRALLTRPVPPGALVTFTFAINAPSVPGSYNFQWMMLQEAVGRFEARTPNVVIQVSDPAARPPFFTQPPTNQTVVAGATAAWIAVASGTPTPVFRWQSKAPGAANFSDILGANAGTYVTPVLLPADHGAQFRCVATNATGSATSAVATVTVFGIAPSFAQHPTNVSVFEGQPATFTATAAGIPTATLQWQVKAPAAGQFTNISGATAGAYLTPTLALADHGSQFRCLASNAAGTATSAAATLTVTSNGPPGFPRIHAKMELQSGDTVVFLGDSITYQALYTQYFEDFYYTRFPNRRIRFRNAGVAGDRATNALVRFDDDVGAFRPRYVTVLLGMNDGAYRDFDRPTFDTYQRNMTTLFDRIGQLGAIAVPITPTMYDGRAARLRQTPAEPRDTQYNGVLGLYGAWLREVAYTRGLGFADVYAPLNNVTTDGRKTDANFTLVPDAVHPDAAGQVVMAVALLEDLGLRGPVSAILIQEQAGQLTATADNGQLTNFTSGDQISFTFTANALPWVLPADARPGYQLTRAGSRHSLEKFTAQNLPPGTYELRIDATPVGIYTAGQLAAGLELQENTLTPQFQQARQVAQLNKDRNATAIRPLRKWWEQLRDKRLELDKAIANHDPDLDAKRAAFAAWLLTFQTGVATLQTLASSFEDQIYQANQPPPRRYELLRVNSAASTR